MHNDTLDKAVLATYEFLLGKPDVIEGSRALSDWWKYLNETCTDEDPCVECLREMSSQT